MTVVTTLRHASPKQEKPIAEQFLAAELDVMEQLNEDSKKVRYFY